MTRCILKSLLPSRKHIQFLQARAAPLASILGKHLLHPQVPRGRGLTGAAGDWGDWQATEKEVHWGQQGLQKTDGAESRASMWGKVDFIGIRAGWLEERFILTAGAEGQDAKKKKELPNFECTRCQLSEQYQYLFLIIGNILSILSMDLIYIFFFYILYIKSG